MALYEIGEGRLEKVASTTFEAEKILERATLQSLLKKNIDAVAPNTMVIAEEYGNWEGSRRRIDLLCIDKEARLIVVELKRTEDGGHMDLQAIRYAAMVSKMTFAAAVQAHREYLEATEVEDDPESAILNFLEWEEPQDDFANEVAIVLVSADFSSELMTAVIWLSEHDIDIRCIALRPYIHAERILLDVQEKFPLPEAADYQIRIREKTREERQVREQSRDLTRYDLKIGDQMFRNLPKRRLAFHVVREAVRRGAAPRKVLEGDRFWLVVSGEHDHDSLMEAADLGRDQNSSTQGFRRFFAEDEELMIYDGKTYALTKQWGFRGPETAARVIKEFGLNDVNFTEASVLQS